MNCKFWDADRSACAQDHFNETPTDASGEAELPAYLQDASPDTPVLMYCTGGIRCDIYSTYLRRKARSTLYLPLTSVPKNNPTWKVFSRYAACLRV